MGGLSSGNGDNVIWGGGKAYVEKFSNFLDIFAKKIRIGLSS